MFSSNWKPNLDTKQIITGSWIWNQRLLLPQLLFYKIHWINSSIPIYLWLHHQCTFPVISATVSSFGGDILQSIRAVSVLLPVYLRGCPVWFGMSRLCSLNLTRIVDITACYTPDNNRKNGAETWNFPNSHISQEEFSILFLRHSSILI